MAYYIYENLQAGLHKAVMHDGACGYCNDGAGRAGGYDPNHAEWHGPFPSLNAALRKQRAMSVKVRKSCCCVGATSDA
jgi:hypothetical protein